MIEVIRRLIRGIMGSDSRLYQAGAAFLDFISVTSKEGIRTWLTLRKINVGNFESALPVPVSLRKLQYPILIRPGTADVPTIINNVIREEYGHFYPRRDPEWMVDAGA